MHIRHAVAAAAVGCSLGITGIGIQTGLANAAPPQCGAPGVQCPPGGPDRPAVPAAPLDGRVVRRLTRVAAPVGRVVPVARWSAA